MTIQTINIGTLANDGTGDDLRAAFLKVNSNFDELDLRNDEATTGTNVGVGGHAVFKQKTGYDLEFRKIIQGDRISVTTNGDLITIAADLNGHTLVSDSGSYALSDGNVFNITGGIGISTSILGNEVTINSDSTNLGFDENFDFGEITQAITSHRDFLQFVTDVDYGTVTAPVSFNTNLGTI